MIYNNKNTIRTILFLIFLFGKSGIGLFAQTTLTGKVTDAESGEELIGANIVVKKNGNIIHGETTDIDGNFSIQVDPGTYDVEVSYTGYPIEKIENLIVKANEKKKVNVDLTIGTGGEIIYCYFFSGYKIPLLEIENTTTGHTLSSEQIKNLPTRNINKISIIVPGVSSTQ